MALRPQSRLLLRVLPLVLAALDCTSCRPSALSSASAALAWSTTDLTFPLTWTGGVRTASLSVDNTGRASTHVSLSVVAPFSVEPLEADVPGGASVAFTVRFAPTTAGLAEAPLVGATGVTVHGQAAAALECPPKDCRHQTFDPLQGTCLETLSPDGEACQPAYSCFADAQCQRGQCVGAHTRCDDADPCTVDVCGETGCAHLDATLDCPWSTDPCQAPTCTPGVGCGLTAVPDGTPCGPRDCSAASVCLDGACVRRAAPQTQGCTELVHGQPHGCTIADGTGAEVRLTAGVNEGLGLAIAPEGTAYFTNGFSVRAVTGTTARTVAGAPYQAGHVDGFGSAVRFEGPTDLVREPSGRLVVADFHTLRRVSPGGLVDTLAGAPGVFEQRDGVGVQAHFGFIRGLAQAPDGTLYVADGAYSFALADGGRPQATRPTVRRVTRFGEVSTTWVGPEFVQLDDLVWLDGGLLAVGGATSASQARFWGLLELQGDGGVKVVSEACTDSIGRVEARADGVLCAGSLQLRQTHADGGVEALASFPAAVGVGGARALAVGPDGAAWTIARNGGCGLWRVADAGAVSVVGADAPGPAWSPLRVIQGPSGQPWFISTLGSAVTEARPDGTEAVVASTSSSTGLAVQGAHVFTVDALGLVSDVVAEPDGGLPVCRCPGGGRLALLGETAICAGAISGVGSCSTDGGSTLLFPRTGNGPVDGPPGVGALGSPPQLGLTTAEGGGVLLAAGNRLRQLDPAGNLSTLTVVDGGLLVAVTRSGSTVYLADSRSDLTHNTNLIRVSSQGQLRTLVELSDAISDLTAEDGGTLLVVVEGAILRVRP